MKQDKMPNSFDELAEAVKTKPCSACEGRGYFNYPGEHRACLKCGGQTVTTSEGHLTHLSDGTGTIPNPDSPLFQALWERRHLLGCATMPDKLGRASVYCDCGGYARRSRAEVALRLPEAVLLNKSLSIELERRGGGWCTWIGPHHSGIEDNWLDALCAALLAKIKGEA